MMGAASISTKAYGLIRKAAVMLAAVVLFVYLGAFEFPVLEQDHECTGEDCHVCEMIELCEVLVNTFAGSMVVAVIAFATIFFIGPVINNIYRFIIHKCPVDIKVRLNN